MTAERTYYYSGNSLLASPVIVDNESLLFPMSTVENDQVVGNLQSINMVTGDVNWTFTAGVMFECTPAVNNGTIYIGNNDSNLYAVNLADGTSLWSLPLGGQVGTKPVFDPGSGLVFTGTTDGMFYAIDPANQTIKWSIGFDQGQQDATAVYPAVVVGGTVFFAASIDNPSAQAATLYAVDISTGNIQWSQSFNTGVSAPIVTGDGLIFVALFDGTMRAFDQTTSDQLWSFQMGKFTLGQPAYNNGWVYFGSMDGNFYAHVSRPQPLKVSEWAVPVNYDVPTGIVLDSDNNAYFGGRTEDGDGFFYVLDLTSAQQGNPQALTDPLEGQLIFTPDLAFNQIAFCAQGFFGGELIEIDLGILGSTSADAMALPLKVGSRPPKHKPLDTAEVGGMLQMASFTSQLIVDDYDVSGTSAVPTTPSFQMMLSLFDENQAPQTSSNVSVWASEPVTVTAGGQTYSIGTDSTNPTVIPASSAGQLAMTSAGSLGIANLFLAPDFFLPGFYLTVFPDTDNFNRMSNLQATDLDPSTALGYNNQPILLGNFQDVNSRINIANSISNTVGRQPQSTPGRMAAMGSLAADTAPGRSYQPGDVPSFQVDFSSGISFSSLSSAQITKSFGGPDGPGDFWLAGSFLGFDDFVNNVVKGVERLGSIIWHFADGVVGAIIHGAENLYQFTVETVDQAIQVAAGIWKHVVADINHVIEWLSFLFSWQDIVNTHLLIKTQVLTTIKNFQSWIDGELNQATNDVDTFFNARENDALSLFDQIIGNLGGQTIDGVRQIGGDPNSAFSSQGPDVTTQANWLPRKLSDNAGGGSLSGVANAALFSTTGDSTTSSAIAAFFQSVGEQIANDPALQSLPGDAQTALKNFSQLFTGSTGFTGQTLADVLAVVRDLVAGLIHLGKVVADSFLKLLQTIVDGIVSFLTGTIEIPFLSQFYKLIAQDDLSVISLFSLIAAVPTTIVYKLITGTSPSANSPALLAAGATAIKWVGLANTFTLLLLLPLWIASDLGNFPLVLSGAIAGATAIQAALGLTLITLGGPNGPDYILWSAQFLSIILAVYGIWLGEAWSATGPTLYGVYGFGMMVFYILYAALEPAKYFDPDSETFFANIASALPYLGQPLSYIQVDEIGPAAVALVDTVGYGVSAALSTILFWTSPQTA